MPASDAAPASSGPADREGGSGTVTVRMFAAARAAAGTGEVLVSPGPTSEVLAALSTGLPPRFAEVLAACSVVADGVRLDPTASAPIAAGTVLDVLPPFAGG
jgi:sulfur-carrier protein